MLQTFFCKICNSFGRVYHSQEKQKAIRRAQTPPRPSVRRVKHYNQDHSLPKQNPGSTPRIPELNNFSFFRGSLSPTYTISFSIKLLRDWYPPPPPHAELQNVLDEDNHAHNYNSINSFFFCLHTNQCFHQFNFCENISIDTWQRTFLK